MAEYDQTNPVHCDRCGADHGSYQHRHATCATCAAEWGMISHSERSMPVLVAEAIPDTAAELLTAIDRPRDVVNSGNRSA